MVELLQNALGFFVQLFPCAVMIFLPFSEEAYRFRRRSVFTWMTIISAAMSAVFSMVICFRDIETYPKHITISNTLMLAAILMILAAYIWLVRGSVMKKLLVFFIVIFYAVTVYLFVNFTYAALFPGQIDTTIYPYTGRFLMLYVLTTVLLLPVMLSLVVRPLKEYICLIEPHNIKREFFIVTFSTMLYFTITVYCITVSGRIGIFRYFLIPALFMTFDQVLIYWLIFRESVRRKHETEQRKAMEIMQLQYEKIVGDMENTRRMRHDLRHHYNSLNDMLDRGNLNEIKDYLAEVIDTTIRRDNKVYCMDMTVNGLLQYYVGLAVEEGIQCAVHAQCGELKIEPADLTVLFGNAMENAINACKKCSDNRRIDIRVGTVQDSFAIEISNSCTEAHIESRFASEDGFLPANAFISDREGGGYGLRSIAHTAQKYDGSAKFRFDAANKIFTVRIRLNMHNEI